MAPIYYIPGNHDPKSFFLPEGERPNLTLKSHNIHKGVVELRPNLSVIGLGGSTISHMQKHGETTFNEIYFPYPYKNDDMFKEDFEPLLNKV